MQFDQFPYSFKEELDRITFQKISQITQSKDDIVRRLNTSADSAESSLRSSKNTSEPNYLSFAKGGFITGLIVGALVCFTNGDAIDAKINFSSSIGGAFMFWLLFGIVGAVIGMVLCGIFAAAQNGSNNSIDNQIATQRRDTEQRVACEVKKCEEEVACIRQEAAAKYNSYLAGFNTQAQQLSVKFAESAVAVEVIDWITAGFCKTIDSADRRSHIEGIHVPFMFKTYRNKIECQLGTFDFEIKRCAELRTPLEQTALSRAIAAAIQLNITMKYPQDASGTDVVTNIEYSYGRDCVYATIDYSAQNGNYRAVRDWN